MRKILLASAAAVAMVASASAADLASLTVAAEIEPNCDISTSVSTVDISSGTGSANVIVTCNFAGTATGTATSQFGGLRSAAGTTYNYNITSPLGNTTAQDLASLESELSGPVVAGANVIPVGFSWDPTGKLAGDYSDTLTFTVSP